MRDGGAVGPGSEEGGDLAGWASERGPIRWLACHSVEVSFALLAAAWLSYALHLTQDYWFWGDDLRLIQHSGTWSGLFQPYNDHLSVIILGVYHSLANVVGLTFRPYAIVGLVCLLAVPVSYFLTTRRSWGPPLAAVFSLPLLWSVMTLRPSNLNHALVLVGAIVCAAALDRGPRADPVLAGALLFALCAAGGGVVVAGACVIHNVLARAPLNRWLAVTGPTVLWVWWWVLSGADPARASLPLSGSERVRTFWDLTFAPFEDIGLGVTAVAAALLAAFLVHGLVQLRRSAAHGANFVAWTAALAAWVLALIRSRGIFAGDYASRYTYVALGFALLAAVPREPIRWSVRSATRAPWALVAAAVVLVLGTLRALAVRDDMRTEAATYSRVGLDARGTLLVMSLDPRAIADDTPLNFFRNITSRPAGELRALIDRYGTPYSRADGSIVQQLVDLEIVRAEPGPTLEAPCEAGRPFRPFRHSPASILLWAPDAYSVEVRRYGDEWVHVADGGAEQTVELLLPRLHSSESWEVRAEGACRVDRSTLSTAEGAVPRATSAAGGRPDVRAQRARPPASAPRPPTP